MTRLGLGVCTRPLPLRKKLCLSFKHILLYTQRDSSPACWHSDTCFWKLLIDLCANFTAFIGWRRSYYCLVRTLFGPGGKYYLKYNLYIVKRV